MIQKRKIYSDDMLANAADNLWLYRVFRSLTCADLADDTFSAELLSDYEKRKQSIAQTHIPLLAKKMRLPERILLKPANFSLLIDRKTRCLIEHQRGLLS